MLEWSSPSIVLNIRSYGETDGIVSVLSLEQGLFRGLVKGMVSRRQFSIWQIGNFINADWSAKVSDQLGFLKGELIRSNFVFLSCFPLAFSVMMSLCSVIENGLLERQPVEHIAQYTFQFFNFLTCDPEKAEKIAVPELNRWEFNFLAELGYGLDDSICHHMANNQSYYVSPRTGKVVTEKIAGKWKPKLFKFPKFLYNHNEIGNLKDWIDGLKLTRYFLEKNVFSLVNKPLPLARLNLENRVIAQFEDNLKN